VYVGGILLPPPLKRPVGTKERQVSLLKLQIEWGKLNCSMFVENLHESQNTVAADTVLGGTQM